MYGEHRNKLNDNAYRFDNPDLEAESLMITIEEENLNCANIADQLFEKINSYKDYDTKNENKYKIFIIDFTNVKQVSETFFFKYLKYILDSKFKIFNYNMSLLVESAWSVCLENFFAIDEIIEEE